MYQVQQKFIEHTRRWGDTARQKAARTRINLLARHGDHFFALLHKLSDALNSPERYPHLKHSVLAEDGLVLGKLLFAVATFFEHVGLTRNNLEEAKALLNSLFFLRYHRQGFVRRGLLYAVARLPMAVTADQLRFPDVAPLLIETCAWLEGPPSSFPTTSHSSSFL